MWIGDQVYFLSDRHGEFNLFVYDTRSKRIEQLTSHDDFPVLAASGDGSRIVYEQGGYLHLFDLAGRSSSKLTVGVAADLIETRARWVKGNQYIRNAAVSPSGARAVFEFRGEIVTVPAEKGDPRNLTLTPGVHERSPAWSPDGTKIAYFSDASGEYRLHVADQDGKGEVEVYTVEGEGFYTDPNWSPDGAKISYVDNSRTLYWFDLETGRSTAVAADTVYGPLPYLAHSWSPDSRWIAYAQVNPTHFRQVFIYSLSSGDSRPVSDGLSDAYDPVFDASGKYLYFFASTDAGPLIDWFSQANNDIELTGSLYLAVLAKGVVSPLAKESDEEETATEETENGNGDDEVEVQIDFDGLDQRILALPVPPAYYADLAAGAAGYLYYLKMTDGLSVMAMMGETPPSSLCRFDLSSREEETLVPTASAFALTRDGGKVLYESQGSWLMAETAAPAEAGKGKLATDTIEVRIEPRAEWPQIFNEVWRINRDEFYDPGMHGADWPAMRDTYAAFLPDLASRNDLNRLIMWMCSELAVGHHRVEGGDFLYQPKSIPGGLLGADLEIDRGRYRFSKIFGGLNWNPDLRSPLTEPGVDVAEGEYLLAVRGRDLRPPENPYAPFENTADTIVEITVGPNPDGSGARTVQVVPVADEDGLRNRAWIEGNLREVDQATGGRVGYVYVPDTTVQGFISFKRYFFPQVSKQALIVDERHNGGGQAADYYIDILRRPYISHWATRYGDDIRLPHAAIFGPKVMLIDETAGSGGDLLPWMFRKLGLGTLIGRPTWGGLVGILGAPVLMDGGEVTAPNLGIWTEDGFVVENVGVPPDIEVEQLPAQMMDGGDPQLERAIELILEQLEAGPPATYERPSFPIRVKQHSRPQG
jgi:tricorn protease